MSKMTATAEPTVEDLVELLRGHSSTQSWEISAPLIGREYYESICSTCQGLRDSRHSYHLLSGERGEGTYWNRETSEQPLPDYLKEPSEMTGIGCGVYQLVAAKYGTSQTFEDAQIWLALERP